VGNEAFDITEAPVNTVKNLAEKYGVAAYCNFIGYVPRDAMPALYHDHHVLVATSLAETFGLAIGEALATGMPVVSTNSGGVAETLSEGNGLVVNQQDHEAVAQAIIQLKTKAITFDPEVVRESVVAKFGRAAFKRRMAGIYKSLIFPEG
jgi:glycosyltransferase involved in cell wall biosynthesis